ncbi:MAG: hypothetical protein IT456_23980 [Planctomycetes bacterium]|jgi:hypothetical protein|nr:hypothetical protein [Planctomycetota bacterium]
MQIPSAKVIEVLHSVGISRLYHANSVATACQFMKGRSLLSRGICERKGLKQTPQASDSLDKRYSIWFDVFMDSVDIHDRAKRANAYGPVLLVVNTSIITQCYTGAIWVTKCNPTRWSGTNSDARWFQGAADLKSGFVKGRFDQMIVIRHNGGELPLQNHLEEIILDDPKHQDAEGTDTYSQSVGALRFAMSEGQLDVPIRRRKCSHACGCTAAYTNQSQRRKMFDPHGA